ncbi:hypothetical protein [Nostoc sp.]|uniref:hypothetical protein n=1 Tax=Nostoc sp. TaxID=1180 RepID=UPI002FFA74D0
MSENPRQFISLDYADADMYGAVLQRPPTATPLNLPLGRLEHKETNGILSPGELAHYNSEEARRKSLVREQVEAQAQRELKLREREIARNVALQGTKTPDANPSEVTARDYEKKFKLPTNVDEHQSLPSEAKPPPTIKGTAAHADPLVEPTAPPRSATIREGVGNAISGISTALPKSLPQAAGRFVIPGVGATLTFAGALIAGQSVQQAATSTVIVTGASLVGGIIGTAVGGPIGEYVGSMVGGFVGSYLANAVTPLLFPSGTTHLESSTLNYPPINTGQNVGVLYRVSFAWDQYFNGNSQGTQYAEFTNVRGPIKTITLGVPPGLSSVGGFVIGTNSDGSDQVSSQSLGYVPASEAKSMQNLSITRMDGKSDILAGVQQPLPPPDNTPYRYNTSPIGNDNTVPSGTPAAGINKGKDKQIAPSMPSNNTPNGAPFFPGHGGLAPSYLPNPEHQPSNLGGMLPSVGLQLQRMESPAPKQPLPYAEPEDIPLPRLQPKNGLTVTPASGGVVPIEYATITPATITPATITVSEGTDALGNNVSTRDRNTLITSVPSSTPSTAQPIPISDANSHVLKANAYPIPKTPEQVATDKTNQTIEQQKKDFDDQIKRLTAIATGLAALTPAIQGIPDAIAKSPTVQAANRETTQGAVCEIAQPGGCLGSRHDQTQQQNAQNANRLDAINTALNTGNLGANADLLAGQATILERLGPQVPGGLSSKLERLAKWLHLDRVLNILIWWQTLHNAYMLSANLGQTLTSAISNVLAAIGIKDAEGSPLEIGEILGSQFDSLAKNVIGESEWGGIKAEYKKWNRIYQAAANLMNSIQSIGYSILSALEVVGSWVASIGNALRKWGEVSEKAYQWMNPTPNFQNKFFTALETTENVVSQIDSVASEVLSVQDTVTQIGTQKTEFLKALGQEPDGKEGTTPPEAAKVKAASDVSKTVSATGIAISDSDKEADE